MNHIHGMTAIPLRRLCGAGICLCCMLLLSSCATWLNRSSQRMNIETDAGIDNIKITGGLLLDSGSGSTTYAVWRRGTPVHIQYRTAAGRDSIEINSHLSPVFLLGNLNTPWVIGYFIDLSTPKRFDYPRNIYLYREGGEVKAGRWRPYRHGDINYTISVPYINSIVTQTPERTEELFGCFGMSLGLEYFYGRRRSIAVSGGTAVNYPLPVPFPTIMLIEKAAASTYISLRLQRVLDRLGTFTAGAGVQATRHAWAQYFDLSPDNEFPPPETKTSYSAGLSLTAQCRLGRYIQLGLLYQPVIVSQFRYAPYGHLLSLELVWKIKR